MDHQDDRTRSHTLPYPIISATLPADDQNALSSLPAEGISSWALAKVSECEERIQDLQRRIYTFKSLYNAAMPIHRLPNEILMRIFGELGGDHKDLRATFVCRHWHSITLATPQMWANALSNIVFLSDHYSRRSRIACMRALLALSAPLRVQLNLELPGDRSRGSESSDAWKLLAKHRGRLAVLDLSFDHSEKLDAFRAVVKSPMENLHELRITSDVHQTRVGLPLKNKDFPRLRHLKIPSGFLISDSIPETLQTLTVVDEPQRLDALQSALEKCAALTSLTFVANSTPLGWAWRTLSRSIHLPHLRKFELLFLRPAITKNMLSHFVLPASTMIHLDASKENDRNMWDIIPLGLPGFFVPPFINRLCIEHPNAPSHGLSLDLAQCCMYIQGAERFRRIFQVRDKAFNVYPESIVDLLRIPPLVELAVKLPDFPPAMAEGLWDRMFEALPHLRRLELLAPTGNAVKAYLTKLFLARHGAMAGELTLVWIAWIEVWHPDDDREAGAQKLTELVQILEAHREQGGQKLAKLEVGASVQFHRWSYRWVPMDPEVWKEVVESFRSRLLDFVDNVVIV